MKEIVKLGTLLLVVSAISALLLGFANEMTKNKIIEQREYLSQQSRIAVIPDADKFEEIDSVKLKEFVDLNDKVKEVFIGYSGETVLGYVVKTAPIGFSGAVEVTTGIDLNGEIIGVRIGSHAETPGLGANATLPKFYTQYEGIDSSKGVETVKIPPADNEIQAISGATITSKAVTEGVMFAIEVYNMLK
ncbi:MAG: RnfABCDGE type electron transport complex subunit G [Acidaminobacteraceae bacterium]